MACCNGCESGHQGGRSPQHARGGHTPHRGQMSLGLESGRTAAIDYHGHGGVIMEAGNWGGRGKEKITLAPIIALLFVGGLAYWLAKE